MLYLYETTYPYTGVIDEYIKVMETDLIPGLNRHMRVMGVFRVAFKHRETFFLSELPQGTDTLEGLSNFVGRERDGLMWHRAGFRYRDEWFDSLLEGLPFSPTAEQVKERQKRGEFTGNDIYYRLIYSVLPGKTDEFLQSFEREMLPAAEKGGMKLAGCYRWFGACGESGEIITLWALKNWAHWGEIHEAAKKDPAFKKWADKVPGLCAEWTYKFFLPAPYSFLH
ncbi:MAG: NIPSNAP family protein [Dehalococcoidia bacterium]|nr:NIPSNAP family protein [Dehalococcoidia bacterium]